MLRTIDDFKNGWAYESALTQKVLDALTDASLAQAVHADHRTLGRMAWHLTLTVLDVAKQLDMTVAGPAMDAPVPTSAKTIADAYKESTASFAAAIVGAWDDASLTTIENVWGMQLPRGVVLNFLMTHQSHHRGQMTVLMRQAGLVVPGIYGPAKEGWAQHGAPAPAI
jgi:uncharacterized damage-inducible protein DinB